MAVIRYTKRPTPLIRPQARTDLKRSRFQRLLWLHRIAPIFLMGVGLALLAAVFSPIIFYEVWTGPQLRAGAQEESTIQFPSTFEIFDREDLFPTPVPTPVVVAKEIDYTDLANWFPGQTLLLEEPVKERTYYLSIPDVGITKAEVVLGGKNLDEHLIQYPGTSDPGDFGSPVIFGHSVLRQFYNPRETNPRRYISIFSTIMTLKNGAEIIIEDDNIVYRYVVTHKSEVQPDDLFILEQQQNARQLKLVTCVPEGTFLRRGVVTAQLQEITQ